jgi:hypothetical protein
MAGGGKFTKGKWSPDESFREKEGDGDYKGVQRVKRVLENLGIDPRKKIYTSRDPEIRAATSELWVEGLPPGFKQMQIPTLMGMDGEPILVFMTIGEPNAKLPPHRHQKDSLLRFVISGSIFFGKVELVAGDWMSVPKGKQYSYTVGPLGAVTMHLYDGLW